MDSIVRLLFGCEAGRLAEPLRPDRGAPSDLDESGLADRARRAGQWCATTPAPVIPPVSRLTAYVRGMS